MTDHTENTAPERIWAVRGLDGIISFNDYDNGEQSYVRADIFAATIADAERRGREAALLAAADACQGVSSHARWHDNSVQSKGASRCHAAILALRTSPDTVPISWDTRPCRIEDME